MQFNINLFLPITHVFFASRSRREKFHGSFTLRWLKRGRASDRRATIKYNADTAGLASFGRTCGRSGGGFIEMHTRKHMGWVLGSRGQHSYGILSALSLPALRSFFAGSRLSRPRFVHSTYLQALAYWGRCITTACESCRQGRSGARTVTHTVWRSRDVCPRDTHKENRYVRLYVYGRTVQANTIAGHSRRMILITKRIDRPRRSYPIGNPDACTE